MNYPASQYVALRKLQSFVDNHKIEENRYFSSPVLMHFDNGVALDEIKREDEKPYNIHMDDSDNAGSEYEEEEFIDIETICPCNVTSTTSRVRNTFV